MKIFEQLERQRHWNEDERMLLDQVQRLADQVIAPAAEHYDRSGEFPQKNVDAINALGLNALFVPEVYGGAPMSIRLYRPTVTTSSSTAPRFSSPTAISPTGFCCSANGRRLMIPKKPSRL